MKKFLVIILLTLFGVLYVNAQQKYKYIEKKKYHNDGYLSKIDIGLTNKYASLDLLLARLNYVNFCGFGLPAYDTKGKRFFFYFRPIGISYPSYSRKYYTLCSNLDIYIYGTTLKNYKDYRTGSTGLELSFKIELPYNIISFGYQWGKEVFYYKEGNYYPLKPFDGFFIKASIGLNSFIDKKGNLNYKNESESLIKKYRLPNPILSLYVQSQKANIFKNEVELEVKAKNQGEGSAENIHITIYNKNQQLDILNDAIIKEILPYSDAIKKIQFQIPDLYLRRNSEFIVKLTEEDGFTASASFKLIVNIENNIKENVQEKIHIWDQKGKYEKIEDYYQRVNGEARKIKIAGFTNDALSLMAYEPLKNNLSKVSPIYDTESELFKIALPGFNELYVHVPIAEAQSFEQNFKNLEITNKTFSLQGNDIVISQLEVSNPYNKKTYHYDITEPATFQSIDIKYAFKPIELNIESQVQPGNIQEQKKTIEVGLADVDVNIPERADQSMKTNTYALIIGNEDYSSYQTGLSKEVNVDYAVNDATIFKEYLIKTIGIPEKNITFKPNETLGQMRQAISKLAALAEIKEGQAELIFYYSGHGLPDETNHEPYLIPVDVSGTNIKSGIKLNEVYKQLTEFPAKRVTIFLDACFSGGARNQPLTTMRSIKIRPKENVLNGNIIVFSSSTGEESSGAYKEKQHGMFTYFLLKKLQETKGDISYKELSDYLYNKVREESVLVNEKVQTPRTNLALKIIREWTDWKLK